MGKRSKREIVPPNPPKDPRDVREKLNDGAYITKIPWTRLPREPDSPPLAGMTVEKRKAVMGKHFSEVEDWEKKRAEAQKAVDLYQQDVSRLEREFVKDLFDELGISEHPKREILLRIAKEHGNNHHDTLSMAEELRELLDL